MLKFLSLCSGIEAASVAWEPLGWKAGAFAEIDPAACDVLAYHYPDTPNLGDMTAPDFIERAIRYGPYGGIVAGTPCQDFSIAGLRAGLAGDRGNLTLRFVEICDAIDPDRIIWENVPGVMSDKTNAFGCLLAGLVGSDTVLQPHREFGWTDAGMVIGPKRAAAWRILDAQYFHLAQRRRRVYVLAVDLRAGIDPGAILLERNSLRRNTPPRREKGEEIAGTLGGGSQSRGWCDDLDRAGAFVPELAHTLRAEHDGSEDGTGRGTPLVTSWWDGGDLAETLNVSSLVKQQAMPDKGRFAAVLAVRTAQTSANGHGVASDVAHGQAIAFTQNQSGDLLTGDVCPAMGTNQNATGRNTPKVMSYRTSGNCGVMEQGDKAAALTQSTDPCAQIIQQHMAVRRLTPRECERLQGFLPDYTLVPRRKESKVEECEYACKCGCVFWADETGVYVECPDCGNDFDEAFPDRIRFTGNRRKVMNESGKMMADGPRYKMIGNSMATNVMHWIGKRIQKAIQA